MMPSHSLIYIVDDDEAVRDSLAALLEAHGWVARSFASATAFLADHRPGAAGCLLLDLQMPGMSGLELQEHLALQRSRLPVIIITGHGDRAAAVKAMRLGAFDFLEKPFTDEDMLDAIERALMAGTQAGQEEALKAAVAEGLARLTAQEHEVLRHLLRGHADKVIAAALGITPSAVAVCRTRLMEKMHARSLSQLLKMALAAEPC